MPNPGRMAVGLVLTGPDGSHHRAARRLPHTGCNNEAELTALLYGLQAAVWTRDLNKAHGVARALRAGTVHVNQYNDDDITVPFGGFKQSGNGRDKSLHAFDKYTELKTTWLRLD